jgi:2-methylcitrate dehydratase PrpD
VSTLEDVLGRAAASTRWADTPAAVRDRVVDLVADTVAVAALGGGRPELRRLVAAHTTEPEGEAAVPGSARGWTASTAALLAGAAVAADQLQDGHRPARGHPASHAATAALALGAEVDATGEAVLSAVLAGYEVGTRLGRAMGGTPAGVHDIGTWGEVAAAVAAAHLLADGDPEVHTRATGLACAAVLVTDATTVFDGWAGSHVLLGASAQVGVSLGRAAASGLAAAPGSPGRHLAAVAAARWDGAVALQDVGPDGWRRWEVLEGYVKSHPTCAHLHGVNDAVADLVAAGVVGGDVTGVRVRCAAGAAQFDRVAGDELAARFSVPTSVAVALVAGRLDETTLTDEMVCNTAVRNLAARVAVVHDPDLDRLAADGRPADVEVLLADGTTRTASSRVPRGDSAAPLSRDQLSAKASRLLTHRFGDGGESVLDAVHALATGGTARDLARTVREAAS